jgi:hypothetical protein
MYHIEVVLYMKNHFELFNFYVIQGHFLKIHEHLLLRYENIFLYVHVNVSII